MTDSPKPAMPSPRPAIFLAAVRTSSQVRGGVSGSSPACSKSLRLMQQAHRVVAGGQAVELVLVLERAEHVRVDVLERRDGLVVDVGRDVLGAVVVQHLGQVGEVGVEDVGLGLGLEHRREARRLQALARGGAALDGDVGVGLVELLDVLLPLLQLGRLRLRRHAVDGERHLGLRVQWSGRVGGPAAAFGTAAVVAAARAAGGKSGQGESGDERDGAGTASTAEPSTSHGWSPSGMNVEGAPPPMRCGAPHTQPP
ncbi:hypothetical protein SVIOM342S_06650 [Streptomyces violaceorubidus]